MNTTNPREYLLVTASGEDRVGLVQRFTSRIAEAGCNIEDSRMALPGGQFAIIMLVSGRWDALPSWRTSSTNSARRWNSPSSTSALSNWSGMSP